MAWCTYYEILNREEYRLAHDEAVLKNMVSKDKYPYIPIILITHSSKAVIKEIMEFGKTSRPFAVKVEFVIYEE